MTLLPPLSDGSQARETLLKWESQDTACLAHLLASPPPARLVSSMPPASPTHNATPITVPPLPHPIRIFFFIKTPPSPRKGLLGSSNGAGLLQLGFSFSVSVMLLDLHHTAPREGTTASASSVSCPHHKCLPLMPDDFLAEVKASQWGQGKDKWPFTGTRGD